MSKTNMSKTNKQTGRPRVEAEASVATWPVIVAGIEGIATGDADAITIRFPHPMKEDIVKLVHIAWNGEKFWPFCPWVALRSFDVREFEHVKLYGEKAR